MGVRGGLLALLDGEPRYGYQLKTAFESSTAGVWPLNIGQVYTTPDRLARDGRVVAGPGDDAGRRTYSITEEGALGAEALAGRLTGRCPAAP